MAAALENGVATPGPTCCRAGQHPGRRPHRPRRLGPRHRALHATGVLAKSSNVGTLMIAQEVGADRFADMLDAVRARQAHRHRAARREPPAGCPRATSGRARRSATCRSGRACPMTAAADGRRCTRRSPTTACGSRRGSSRRPSARTASAPRRRGAEPVRVVSPADRPTLRTMLEAVTQDGGTATRGTGAAGGDRRLPGRRQDRHRAAGRPDAAAATATSTTGSPSPGMLPARQDPRYVVGDHAGRAAGRRRARRRCSTTSRSYLAQREKLPVNPDPEPAQTRRAPAEGARAGAVAPARPTPAAPDRAADRRAAAAPACATRSRHRLTPCRAGAARGAAVGRDHARR